MDIKLEKKSYSHGENVNIIATLYDQASDEIKEDIMLRIYDPKGKELYKEEILSGSEVKFPLSEQASPGEWRINVKSSKLETDKYITVESAEKLDIELVYQTLKIKNSGNVNYEKPLEIVAIDNSGKEKYIEVRTNLNPGEIIEVGLFKQLADGVYEIKILNTGESFNVEIHDDRNVATKTGDFFKSISGQAVRISGSKNSGWLSYIFGLVIVLFVVFIAFYNRRGILKFGFIKRRKKEKRKTSKTQPHKSKKAQEKEDVEEFKNRILKDIEKAGIIEEKKEKDLGPYSVKPFFPIPPEKTEEKPNKFSFDRPLRRDR